MKVINRSSPLSSFVSGLILFALCLVFQGTWAQKRSVGLLEKASAGKFRPGHYTMLDGTRQAGRIRIWHSEQRNLLQVDSGTEVPHNISPAELRSVVIGTDSLTVVRHFHHLDISEPVLSSVPDFCRVKMSGKVQVLEHERLIIVNNAPMGGAGGMMYGGGQNKVLVSTMLLRTPIDTGLYVLPTSAATFSRATARLFADHPPLCQQMTAGYVGYNDFKRIIYAYLFRREIGQVSYEQASTIF